MMMMMMAAMMTMIMMVPYVGTDQGGEIAGKKMKSDGKWRNSGGKLVYLNCYNLNKRAKRVSKLHVLLFIYHLYSDWECETATLECKL